MYIDFVFSAINMILLSVFLDKINPSSCADIQSIIVFSRTRLQWSFPFPATLSVSPLPATPSSSACKYVVVYSTLKRKETTLSQSHHSLQFIFLPLQFISKKKKWPLFTGFLYFPFTQLQLTFSPTSSPKLFLLQKKNMGDMSPMLLNSVIN